MNMWQKTSVALALLTGLAGCSGSGVGESGAVSMASETAPIQPLSEDRPAGLVHFTPPKGWQALAGGTAPASRWVQFEGTRVAQMAPILLVEAEGPVQAIAHLN